MILLADSGSTKTDWLLIDNDRFKQFRSVGLNPYHTGRDFFVNVLKNDVNHNLGIEQPQRVNEIYFYGAGCGIEQKQKDVKNWLGVIYDNAHVEVASDLLAAARATCGKKEGIVVILGTGSNSCLYDGQKIIDKQISLGYILGDEGSGAYLGKQLIKMILEEKLPRQIIQKFYTAYAVSQNEILDNIYNKPLANRYLAGFTKFIADYINNQTLYELVKNAFDIFIENNLCRYKNYNNYKVNCVGSVAWYFKKIFKKSCKEKGLICDNFVRNPIEKLLEYHRGEFN